ncbi:hypothetical protein SAMN06297251_12736 [Fulvimarina manganoxydans]|uniref:Prophage minor tail protein Z (GPZ) n=1 Tax=Fulvimarina manganoxydans TaxID=937218 RepID=A0A1W2EK37_9HYPH|nr:hypothetical protein [Fulvimarina manganoxydans]SMD10099.1 hypothetical protein SAMN06297251_12736 [Fulvimarina manganoxydans]
MTVVIRWDDRSGLERMMRGFRGLSDAKLNSAFAQALNHTGGKARRKVRQNLTKQTGLRRKTIVAAVKEQKARSSNLRHVLASQGGNIRVTFFSPKESEAGVIAKPFGRATLYPGSFMRGGAWPDRVDTTRFGGHVMYRETSGKWPVASARSGVVIPDEMVKGATAAAWEGMMNSDLERRVLYDVNRASGGLFR